MPGHLQPAAPELPDEARDALSAGAGPCGSELPGPHLDPGWADRLDAHHFAIACQSSAAVLAREGRGDHARALRAAAAQAETRIPQGEHDHPEDLRRDTDGEGWPDLRPDRWNEPAHPLTPPIDDHARGAHPADGSGQRQKDGG